MAWTYADCSQIHSPTATPEDREDGGDEKLDDDGFVRVAGLLGISNAEASQSEEYDRSDPLTVSLF